MKTPLLQLSLLSIWMVATGGASVAATEPGPSAQLDAIVDEYLELNRQGGVPWPGGGSGADGAPDLSPESFEARVQRRRELLARVRSLETGPLTGPERTDRRLLVALLDSSIYDAERRRSWQNQPSLYLPVRQISRLFPEPGDGGSIDEERAVALLRSVKPATAQGQKSLRRPTERATREAIFQAEQTLAVLREGTKRLLGEEARTAAAEALTAVEKRRFILLERLMQT